MSQGDTQPGEAPPRVEALVRNGAAAVRLSGDWTVRGAVAAAAQLEPAARGAREITLSLAGIGRLDTAGAFLIHRFALTRAGEGANVVRTDVPETAAILLEAVAKADTPRPVPPRPPSSLRAIAGSLGQAVEESWQGFRESLGFVGLILVALTRMVMQPKRLRLTPLVYHMEQSGLNAVPIVALMSFLIGGVLAFQGSQQLQRFGAEIFTVNLIAISFLREVGILLTAIMVAGRSGSAFTAQIGSMKVYEEVDAMRALALDPIEILVVPRVTALMLTLPLLGFVAAMAGLAGGGFVSWVALDLSPPIYLQRLREAVDLWDFWVGIIKAPFFAFLIAMIGCYEGMKVEGSAESVGLRTTQSVVEGIFGVIILNAFFSVFFVQVGI